MGTKLHMTLRGVHEPGALKQRITEEAGKLERFCDRLLACRVEVNVPQRQKHNQEDPQPPIEVHLDVTAPGGTEIAVRRQDADVYAAVHAAFQAAGKQLHEHIAHKWAG